MTDWDKAYLARRAAFPMETGQGLRCPYTPPDRADSRIGLAMRFCIGFVLVCLVGILKGDL